MDSNAILSKIADIMNDHYGIDQSEVQLTSSVDDLGLDSLDLVELVMEMEEEFDITVEEDAFRKEDLTVGDFVNYVIDKQGK